MKKAIAALLASFLGLFGYQIVDKAMESRVENLEYQVSSQQEVILSQQKDMSLLKHLDPHSWDNLSIGDTIHCDNVSGPFDWVDCFGNTIHIDSCELVLRKKGKTVEDAFIETVTTDNNPYTTIASIYENHAYAYCFEFISTGRVDPSFYDYGGVINIIVSIGQTGTQYYMHGKVNKDGSFIATYNSDLNISINEPCGVKFFSAYLRKTTIPTATAPTTTKPNSATNDNYLWTVFYAEDLTCKYTSDYYTIGDSEPTTVNNHIYYSNELNRWYYCGKQHSDEAQHENGVYEFVYTYDQPVCQGSVKSEMGDYTVYIVQFHVTGHTDPALAGKKIDFIKSSNMGTIDEDGNFDFTFMKRYGCNGPLEGHTLEPGTPEIY